MGSHTLVTLNIRGASGKTPALLNFIHKHNIDILLLQETNFNTLEQAQTFCNKLGIKQSIHSTGEHSRGTSILCTTNKYKLENMKSDTRGRFTSATIKENTTEYTIINIYAPTKKQEQKHFYRNLQKTITTEYKDQKIVLAGDFNMVLNMADMTGQHDKKTRRIKTDEEQIDILESIICTKNLKDAHTNKPNSDTETTYFSTTHHSSSRLDRIYVHEDTQVTKIKHIAQTLRFTDHKATLVQINTTPTVKSKSAYWKFNNNLLENDRYITAIKDTAAHYTQTMPKTYALEHWEDFKYVITKLSIKIAREINIARKQQEKYLETQLDTLISCKGTRDKIDEIERELNTLHAHKYKGALIRSRIDTLGSEEPSHYNIILEQIHANNKNIHSIKTSDGTVTTDPEAIKQSFTTFYQQLFESEEVNADTQDKYLKHIIKADDEDRRKIDTPISKEDILKAINGLKLNKAPGPDGLTNEFYRTFVTDLVPILQAAYSDMHKRRDCGTDFNRSYITLIPKPDTDKTLITSYRPISLLNSDYKILTKILVNKLETVIPKLINSDQQCSVQGRNIQNHTHLIRDIIQYSTHKNTKLALLSIDQQKAFDRVAHTWLFKTIEAYNLGNYFSTWIKTLYNKAHSHLLVNNNISTAIHIQKSVRQGCPLSPILYILSLEPLLENIRQDSTIKGLKLPNIADKKILAYADDTTFLLQSEKAIKTVMEKFIDFGKASGGKINTDKSKVMGAGQWVGKDDYNTDITVVDKLKIYGITYTGNNRMEDKATWLKLTKKIETCLNKYKNCNTTIFARAALVNRYIIPKVIFIATNSTIPNFFIKTTNKHIREFIFKNTIRNISNKTLIQSKLNGGIGLHDIHTKINTFRLKHLDRIRLEPHNHPLAQYYIGLKIKNILKVNITTPHYGGDDIGNFYREILKIYKGNSNIIGENPKNIYDTLVKKQATPLHHRIKWAREYNLIDISDTFRNLHKKQITPKEREISYRLTFNTTPISRNTNTNKNIRITCQTCKQNIQETEKHTFLECDAIQLAKQTLKVILKTKQTVTANKAITLNNINKTGVVADDDDKLIATAIFRSVVWFLRNKIKHDGFKCTPKVINEIFKSRLRSRLSQRTYNFDGQQIV